MPQWLKPEHMYFVRASVHVAVAITCHFVLRRATRMRVSIVVQRISSSSQETIRSSRRGRRVFPLVPEYGADEKLQ
mgnify:CR=1 FL=1